MYETEKEALINLWFSLSQSCGWWHPFKGVVFICERPSVQAVNARGQLHCESGPAILCRDSWEVYALNNVRMKKCQVMTPAEQITPREVLSEPNADVRRELIRKVGVERMLAKLPNKSLDKRDNYECLSVNLGAGAEDARYLRMLNPSTGTWHLEGVPAECNTVEESLNWRNGQMFKNAEILT